MASTVPSVLRSSTDGGEAVKKGKVYENERQIKHKRTPTYPHMPPLPLSSRSVSGGHLFRKVKKGLSVHFTLEIKLGFKWWPLTGGRICSVTNFAPSPSPGGSPAWPHPGNLWPPFAWTKRAEGRVFRPTEITCLHKQYEGLIPGFLSHNHPHEHYYDNSATQRQYQTCNFRWNRSTLSPDGRCFHN